MTFLPNAGKLAGAKFKEEGNGHLSLLLENGSPCEGSKTNYSTRFDFFCNDGEAEKVGIKICYPQLDICISKCIYANK